MVAYGSSSVVAAGTIRSLDLTGENTINNLRTVPLSVKKGRITMTFDDYRMDEAAQYLIDARALVRLNAKLSIPTVELLEFRPEGFVLQVTRGTQPLYVSQIQQLQFRVIVAKLARP